MSVGERGKGVPFRSGTPGWAVGHFPGLGQSFAPGPFSIFQIFSLFCFYLIFFAKAPKLIYTKTKICKKIPLSSKTYWEKVLIK
jgi:hypothetical protein